MADEIPEAEAAAAPESSGEDSLRADLAAAIAGASDDAPAARDEGAAPDAPAAEAARARDEAGRFAKPGDAAHAAAKTNSNSNSETTAPTQAEPSEPTAIAPPASWSATAKAAFAKADPVIQREVLKREAYMMNGAAQWQSKGERLNRLDAVLAPRRERFQLAGFDDAQAIQSLLAAQDYLERDPVNALVYLARQSGVDLRTVAQQLGGGQAQAPQLPPQLQPLVQQVQTLTHAVAQQQQASVEARRTEFLGQVDAFARDPANLYFENVREKMSELIRSGQAADLPSAYEQAIWSSPEIRPLLLRRQQDELVAQTRTQASAKAAQARHASGSITGSPSPGASPGRPSPNATLRDDLIQAWNAVAG